MSTPKTPKIVEEVSITQGARIVRKPIYQWRMDQAKDGIEAALNRVVVAKSLGFTAFEIDVTMMQVPALAKPAAVDLSSLFNPWGHMIAQPPVEGEEWKHNETRKALTEVAIVTIYAVVVE
jgi:hypothetical protein